MKKDSGRVYIAQNAARHPDSPLEPLFRSLYVSEPTFDITAIDVVTDRNNVRKLLGFVNSRWSGYKREDFTIHVEVTKNTAILSREETKVVEYIGANEFKGYGHSFEKKYTTRQVSRSTGHHRIVKYNFGGLEFILRHETDGYVEVASAQSNQQPNGNQAVDVDDLSSVLGSLSLSTKSTEPEITRPEGSKLTIRKEGRLIPLPSTLEIKTRVAHRPLAFEDVVSQLWVSQTPKLVRAYHTKGVFVDPVVENVTVQIKAWETQNQKDLRKLAGLITKIREVTKENGGKAVLKYEASADKLVFYKQGDKKMLPEDLYLKWEIQVVDKEDVTTAKHGDEGDSDGKKVRGGDASDKQDTTENDANPAVGTLGQSIKDLAVTVSEKFAKTVGMDGDKATVA